MNDHPLRLAVGSHQAGSGKGCLMNVISWENGDSVITDTPDCADPFLTTINQRLNDSICTHRDSDLLCAACTQLVLPFGWASVGTAGVASKTDYVRLAVMAARDVVHLNDDPRVLEAIEAAEEWIATGSNATARSATTYAYGAARAAAAHARAATAAAYAASFAARSAAARSAAAACDDASFAAVRAGTHSPLEHAQLWHQRWTETTGHTTPTTAPTGWDQAIKQMTATTQ